MSPTHPWARLARLLPRDLASPPETASAQRGRGAAQKPRGAATVQWAAVWIRPGRKPLRPRGCPSLLSQSTEEAVASSVQGCSPSSGFGQGALDAHTPEGSRTRHQTCRVGSEGSVNWHATLQLAGCGPLWNGRQGGRLGGRRGSNDQEMSLGPSPAPGLPEVGWASVSKRERSLPAFQGRCQGCVP